MREDNGGIQFFQEWQQFCEEVELQDLNDYLNELAEYYGNQDEKEDPGVTADEANDNYRGRQRAGL